MFVARFAVAVAMRSINLHLKVSTRASLFMLFHAPRAELYFSEVATEATFPVDVA